ncbi:hypothetical protein A0H81_11139 [Grifola frondosa]|uniref:DUF6534 domain-containing protein n=1 Tax=Grifola frondosa TaxID=5627 RepID=A0A1C7LVK5_GRIFR|nr:hypothetical protein A0H81_11139 [Grifola frondosa]
MIPEFVHFRNFEVIVIIWLACSAVADSVITIALVWHLRRHKTGFSVTDDVVNRIIRLTVHTGLVTALCATIDLVLFLAMPAGLHLIFNLPLSKLYTNSLMSTLNSRAILKYGASDNTSGSNQMRAEKGLNMRADQGNGRISGGQQVFIDVESHEMVDTMDTKKRPSFAAPAMPHMANLEGLNVANTKEAMM